MSGALQLDFQRGSPAPGPAPVEARSRVVAVHPGASTLQFPNSQVAAVATVVQ